MPYPATSARNDVVESRRQGPEEEAPVRHPMVFVSAADCSGKSTLLRRLAAEPNGDQVTYFQPRPLRSWGPGGASRQLAPAEARFEAAVAGNSDTHIHMLRADIAGSPLEVQLLKLSFFELASSPQPVLTVLPAAMRSSASSANYFSLLETITGRPVRQLLLAPSWGRFAKNLARRRLRHPARSSVVRCIRERRQLLARRDDFDAVLGDLGEKRLSGPAAALCFGLLELPAVGDAQR